MKVFVAGLSHESSSFSPITTSRRSFEEWEYHRPPAGRTDDRCRSLNGYGGFVRAAERAGHSVFASTSTWAQPSGPCSAEGYESLRDEILGDLASAGDIDAAFFFLHGAQLADGYDDCEGDLLSRARQLLGPRVFIGALLDLHANVSARMVETATVLAACREYPHTDFDERAAHLVAVAERVVESGLTPTARLVRVPMIGMFNTTLPLMAAANEAAARLERREGALSVSLLHGFAWSDVPEAGAAVLMTTDRARPDLEPELEALARQFFAAREETVSARKSVDETLDYVEAAGPDAASRPFVIADTNDNAGGGAGSDSTFILEEILNRGLTGYALGVLWDPVVAELAAHAGSGARFPARIGGKTGPAAGRPLDVNVRVLAVARELYQAGIGFRVPIGTAAALEVRGNVVVVSTIRGQVFSPTCFTDLGVEPSRTRALVVKSSQHFYDQFAPLAREVLYCDTPGLLSLRFDNVQHTKLRRPVWPLDTVQF